MTLRRIPMTIATSFVPLACATSRPASCSVLCIVSPLSARRFGAAPAPRRRALPVEARSNARASAAEGWGCATRRAIPGSCARTGRAPDAGNPCVPRTRRGAPRTPAGSAAGSALEVLPDEKLERAEVALREVLEAPAAGGDGGLGALEALDDPQQVLVVLAELQLHAPDERRVAGQGQRGPRAVAAGLDQGAEAEALEPLRHGAAVPAERARGRLHVEGVAPEAREDGDLAVPGRLAGRPRRGGQPEVLQREHRPLGQGDGLAQALLELAHVAGPVVARERRPR